MAPVIQPDPDLRVAESGLGATLRGKAQGLSGTADQIGKTEQQLAATNSGTTIDRILIVFDGVRKNLDEAADQAWVAAKFHDRLAAAAARYRSDAPTVDEVLAAAALFTQANATAAAAERRGGSYAAEYRALQRAKDHLAQLVRKRADAIAAFKADEAAAVADYQAAAGAGRDVGRTSPVPEPVAPAPRTTTPTAPEALPPPGGPASVAPAELPGGATLPAPETNLAAASTAGPSLSPAQAAVLGAALAQQQPQQQAQPQMPVQMPAPTLSPPQPQKQPEDPFANDVYDPNAVLAALARGDFRPSTATVTAPAITAAALPESTTTFTPLGLNGVTAANPVASQPIVTGTSLTGLETASNVSGRADGTAARTATSPGPASHLSAAGAEQATGRAGAAGTGTGTGMGGVPPIMGGPMGAMSGSGAAERKPVTAEANSDKFILDGSAAISEAVPGGTIAQRKDDAA